jgi:hypothetical protein
MVCDKQFRKPYPNVEKWFVACTSKAEFKVRRAFVFPPKFLLHILTVMFVTYVSQAVIGDCPLCTKELKAQGDK